MTQNYPSILLENAVNQMSSLPGVGRKTALRLVLHLLRQPEADVQRWAGSFVELKTRIHYCRRCHNLTDQDICPICSALNRDQQTICVVENIQDVMQIENTGQYRGLYHVLGGVISPMEGVGPKDLEIDSLIERVQHEKTEEVILALPTTMEGDTTNFYLYRRLTQDNIPCKITQIARGVAVGNELEYTDEITLGRSIINRIEFKG